MNSTNTLMNKPSRDFFHKIAWDMLDMNSREYMIAFRAWQQRRKEKKSPRIRIQRFLKKLT